MTIEERFERLEKESKAQIKRLKKWMAGSIALALVAIVAGTVGVGVCCGGESEARSSGAFRELSLRI